MSAFSTNIKTISYTVFFRSNSTVKFRKAAMCLRLKDFKRIYLFNFGISERQILGTKKAQQLKLMKSRITSAYATFENIGDFHSFKVYLSRTD